MDEILINEIRQNNAQQENSSESGENTKQKTWLLFKSFDSFYALESSNVREVLRKNDVFPIPFTPSYIKGVLNYYGKPYAVVDFALLQNLTKTTASLFLVLNNSGDIALQIDDIIDFYSSDDVEEQQIVERSEYDFFSQTITINKIIAPVIDVDAIEKKVSMEIESN